MTYYLFENLSWSNVQLLLLSSYINTIIYTLENTSCMTYCLFKHISEQIILCLKVIMKPIIYVTFEMTNR